MLEINLRALTNVKPKLEEAWARVRSGVAEIAEAILCQLNNGVFRLSSWWGNAMGNDGLRADAALFEPDNFCQNQNQIKPRTFPSSKSCKMV